MFQPIDLVTGTCIINQKIKEPCQFVIDLKDTLENVHTSDRTTTKCAVSPKEEFDVKLYHHMYSVGDIVYKINSSIRNGESKKLKPPWEGQYLLTRVLSHVLYTIPNRRRESTIHHDRLKLCEDRSIPVWMKRLRNHLFNVEGKQERTDDQSDIDAYPSDSLHLLFENLVTATDQDEVHIDQVTERDSGPVLCDQHDTVTDSDSSAVLCDHDGRPIAITNLADSLPDDGDQDLDRTFIYSIEDDRTTNIPDETFINTDEEHGVAEQPNRRNRNRPKNLDS